MTSNFAIPTLCALICVANGSRAADVAFNRIVHGWTNYSSSFLATHDSGSGDYATVAAFYTPDADVNPREFAAILVSDRLPGEPVDFSKFSFVVGIWNGLDSFTNAPRRPDVASFSFASPTGGSTDHPDAITRGGRPAYELRFTITNRHTILLADHTYLIGFFAQSSTSANGLLYVPTSSHGGDSDVQAGNTIIGGWLRIADAGGSTIYSGQLATEFLVDSAAPPLTIVRGADCAKLLWPADFENFMVEVSADIPMQWNPVNQTPIVTASSNVVRVPIESPLSVFRLHRRYE